MAETGAGGREAADVEPAAAAEGADGLPHDALELLRRLPHTRRMSRGDEGEVVLEVELDGARYTLLREVTSRAAGVAALSAREREIARMVARGYTNKAIASVLEISTWTVGTHLRRVFGKLGVHSRSAMVARLAEVGALGDGSLDPDWRALWSAAAEPDEA